MPGSSNLGQGDALARMLPNGSVRQIQFGPVFCLPPGKCVRGQASLLTELPWIYAAIGPLQKLLSPIHLAFRGGRRSCELSFHNASPEKNALWPNLSGGKKMHWVGRLQTILPLNSANPRWLQPNHHPHRRYLAYIVLPELPSPAHRVHHRVYRAETAATVPAGLGDGG